MTTPTLGNNFVQSDEEYEKTAQATSGEVWIKGFRGGETKIRPLVEPEDFKTYLEHYADGFGYFPCSRLKDCVGCTSVSEKTKQRSRRWAMQALDSNARQQVYKMGKRLKQKFTFRKDRAQTVTDRDFVVVRTGTVFNDITYELEPEDKFDIEYNEPLYDIPVILAEKYAEAVRHFSGVVVEPDSVVTIHDESIGRKVNQEQEAWGAGSPLGADSPDAGPAPWEQDLPPVDETVAAVPDSVPEVSLGDSEQPNFDEMSAGQLRDWLTAQGVEFPEREVRSRLLKRAQSVLTPA